MLTKILTGGFILIMIGAVVAGAIAVLGPSDEAHGSAEARGRNTELGLGARAETVSEGRGQGAGGQRQGQGEGLGRGQEQVQDRGRTEGLDSNSAPQELLTVEGLVVETDELVVETASGEAVQIGLGPSGYREAQGFVLQTGDNVRVSGYWEDDEFKATEVENQTTGQSIVLRDASGRPMWAGQGRGRNRTS